jgi:tRNA dimethylallyltransferase
MKQKTLVVILGPTGVGKSHAALRVADYFHTEIISADSRQIFRELHIGTATPSAEDLRRVKHHFIGSRSITGYYNASMYEAAVLDLLDDLFQKHTIVVMTGGSMLYLDAVCKGIDALPSVDPELRASLLATWKTEGLANLRLRLKKLDPRYYREVDLKNPKRILHALEICLMTGKPYSSLRSGTEKKRPFHIFKVGLNCNRQVLYEKINLRTDRMIHAGLIDEARHLYPQKHLNALNTVGYKELFAFFDGTISREEAIEQIKNNTRKYARKQLTWFRRDPSIHWFEPDRDQEIIECIKKEVLHD